MAGDGRRYWVEERLLFDPTNLSVPETSLEPPWKSVEVYLAADYDALLARSLSTENHNNIVASLNADIAKLQREVEALRATRNNLIACVNCKQPVEVTARNAIKCEACVRLLAGREPGSVTD